MRFLLVRAVATFPSLLRFNLKRNSREIISQCLNWSFKSPNSSANLDSNASNKYLHFRAQKESNLHVVFTSFVLHHHHLFYIFFLLFFYFFTFYIHHHLFYIFTSQNFLHLSLIRETTFFRQKLTSHLTAKTRIYSNL